MTKHGLEAALATLDNGSVRYRAVLSKALGNEFTV